jgi:hypothetical protein
MKEASLQEKPGFKLSNLAFGRDAATALPFAPEHDYPESANFVVDTFRDFATE